MKYKYRIKETTYADGSVYYSPQFCPKWLPIWLGLCDFYGSTHHNCQSKAQKIIDRHIEHFKANTIVKERIL